MTEPRNRYFVLFEVPLRGDCPRLGFRLGLLAPFPAFSLPLAAAAARARFFLLFGLPLGGGGPLGFCFSRPDLSGSVELRRNMALLPNSSESGRSCGGAGSGLAFLDDGVDFFPRRILPSVGWRLV